MQTYTHTPDSVPTLPLTHSNPNPNTVLTLIQTLE